MKYVNENEITKQISAILKTIQIPEEAYELVSNALREDHEKKKKAIRNDSFLQ